MEKRCSFELFKSNVCHWLKEEGDIDFLIQVLESDLILKYYWGCLIIMIQRRKPWPFARTSEG